MGLNNHKGLNMAEDKKQVSSEQHTLYAQDILEKKKLIDKDKNLYEITPKHTVYRIFIGRFFELKKGLHAVFNELKKAKKDDKFEIIINSGGGFVNEGMQFYNIILEKFPNSTTTYLDNRGYSMGALLFSMGSKRVIYPYSDLMYHNYAGGAFGKGEEIKAQVKHFDKLIQNFFHEIIVSQGFLSEDEYRKMIIGKDYWFDAKELCKRGIATHVIVDGEEITAKEFLKLLKKRKKAKKQKKKLTKEASSNQKSKKNKK
jgi:ATP-dependent protease ClpP protease subunit